MAVFVRRALASSCNAVGGALAFTGRLDAARRCHQWAVRVAGSHRSLTLMRATTLIRLGVVEKTAGHYEAAAEHYCRATALVHAAGRPTLEFEAVMAHNLAGLALARGDLGAAEMHARRAIVDRRAAHAAPHVIARDEVVLGAVLATQGRNDEARTLFLGARSTLEEAFGSNHYEVGVVCLHLGALEQARDAVVAQRHYERALAIKLRTRGPRHPELGVIHNNLGIVHRAQGRDDLAATHFDTALRLLRRRYGPDHPATRTGEANLTRMRVRRSDNPTSDVELGALATSRS